MTNEVELTLEQQKAVALAAGLDLSRVGEGSVRVIVVSDKQVWVIHEGLSFVSRADYDKAVG